MAEEIFEFRDGQCLRYNGNYSDYAEKIRDNDDSIDKPKKKGEKKERVFTGKTKLRFSFKEQREYDNIDDEIAALEQAIADTDREIAANTSDYVKLQELSDKKSEMEQQLEQKMERWVYLNELAERIANGEMV